VSGAPEADLQGQQRQEAEDQRPDHRPFHHHGAAEAVTAESTGDQQGNVLEKKGKLVWGS